LTANLGIDYQFGSPGGTFSDQGVKTEFYVYQPFDKEKRMYSVGMSYDLYF
jgi:hypothetical protein